MRACLRTQGTRSRDLEAHCRILLDALGADVDDVVGIGRAYDDVRRAQSILIPECQDDSLVVVEPFGFGEKQHVFLLWRENDGRYRGIHAPGRTPGTWMLRQRPPGMRCR